MSPGRGQAQPLSDEDKRFLRELVETNRSEHHGRLSYMDIMFELEHHYGNSLPGPVLGEVARLLGTLACPPNRLRHITRCCRPSHGDSMWSVSVQAGHVM